MEFFNRIVLIGNGFDLAHDLPTTFNDFLLYLFQNDVRNVIETKNPISNPIYSVSHVSSSIYREIDWNDTLKDFESIFSSLGPNLATLPNTLPMDVNIVKNDIYGFLLSEQNLINNWTNIESFYFRHLTRLFNDNHQKENITKYNDQFSEIKKMFKFYLESVVEPKIQSHIDLKHKDLINQLIGQFDLDIYSRFFKNGDQNFGKNSFIRNNIKLNEIKIINFNYTSLVGKYLQGKSLKNIELVPIHGTVDSEIIFGYGDDTIPIYKEIEQNGHPDYLLHSKAFYYPFTNHYRDLMNFLGLMDYEIVIIGHSLGLSDRVMLKTLFEHNNCKAIRLFHRGTKENWQKKYRSLSPHFEDKQKMRNKIVEFNPKDVFI